MVAFFDFFKNQGANRNFTSGKTTIDSADNQVISKSKPSSVIGLPPKSNQPYSGTSNSFISGYNDIKISSSLTNASSINQSSIQNNPQKKETASSSLTSSQSQLSSQKKEFDKTSSTTNQKQQELDLMTHLTQRSNRVFVSALNKAKQLKSPLIDSEHLLHGLLSDVEIYNLFTELKIQPQIIEEELNKIYQYGNSNLPPKPSPRLKRILSNSLIIARKLGFEFISPEHLLLALYEEGEGVGARVLAKLGLKKEDLNKKIIGKKEGLQEKEKEEEKRKSALDQFTIDLTTKAAQGLLDPVVERSEVVERVVHILSRRTKNNPVLIGEAGVGKTAIVEGLAQRIVTKNVPEPLINKRILQLDLMSILAGASHRGEFEERMKNLIEEIKNSQGQIILFIDEIHNIVGAGSSGEGSLDASNFLKPALARGELQIVGATTTTEYRRYIEKDPALERRFQPVVVPEPSEEQAIKMLMAIKDKYEAYHRVVIPKEAIEAAVRLSKRYIGDRFLPDKAVDLIDEAASAVRLPLISLPEEIKSLETRITELSQEMVERQKKGDVVQVKILRSKIDDLKGQLKEKQEEYNLKKAQSTTAVTIEIIKDIVSRWTGIPVSQITESELEKLANLEEIMHKRLINQEEAVKLVAQAVRRGRAGLKSQNRPIGSFVFLGPTGVGKTELAKTLAEVLFGYEEAMIRFDMTEYMEKHEVAKLLGAPPGYVGYEEGGKLTEAVRRKPYSVILFDEIEKAHPDIFNIFLQILDDGRLTDNKGHTVSFKNTVVICTSNIGTKVIQDELLKKGGMEVEEPPVLSTYVFTPRGREILTIGNNYFEREKSEWEKGALFDYFAGQKIDEEEKRQGEKMSFPIDGFDTHAISGQGIEVITKGNLVFMRNSTTAKVWQLTTLIDYFKEGIVINALPDEPEEQLPTIKLNTHAFDGEAFEIVTFRNRFWKRKIGSNDWQTGELKEYFSGHNVDKDTLPFNYWDIHAFSPSGEEIIIVGDNLWLRKKEEKEWKKLCLKDYFGNNFPLEKELEEKQKVEEEIEKKRLISIKNKVMEELRKFFRPELINRFDEIVIFEPLRFPHMMEIVKLQLKGVGKALEEQGIGFSHTEKAVKEIVRAGFDPIFGARPLRRAIQRLIENPISTLIIEGKIKSGEEIEVDFDGEGFVFNVKKVIFVEEDDLKKSSLRKSFFCKRCHFKFQTEIVKNATFICPHCLSKDLRELAYEEEKDNDQKREKLNGNQKSNSDLDPGLKKEKAMSEMNVLAF